MAPELFKGERYDNKADIWSLGIILYEMAALDVPFSASHFTKLVKRVCQARLPPIPKQYSNELQELLNDMLMKNPDRRPRIHDILRRPEICKRIEKYLSSEQLKAEFEHSVIHEYQLSEEIK